MYVKEKKKDKPAKPHGRWKTNISELKIKQPVVWLCSMALGHQNRILIWQYPVLSGKSP